MITRTTKKKPGRTRMPGRLRAGKAESTRCSASSRRSATNTLGTAPDEVTWGHVGSLEQHAELLKRITDMAFNEGEHAKAGRFPPCPARSARRGSGS